jgi:hypothetical protein
MDEKILSPQGIEFSGGKIGIWHEIRIKGESVWFGGYG